MKKLKEETGLSDTLAVTICVPGRLCHHCWSGTQSSSCWRCSWSGAWTCYPESSWKTNTCRGDTQKSSEIQWFGWFATDFRPESIQFTAMFVTEGVSGNWLATRKSNQAVREDVDSERVVWCHVYVNPQVKLVATDEVGFVQIPVSQNCIVVITLCCSVWDSRNGLWVTDFWTRSGLFRGIWLHLWMTWIPIPLADAGFWRRENKCLVIIDVLEQKMLFKVTYRFDDPFLSGATVLPGLTEKLNILRKNKGPRKKAELLFAKATLHLRQISPQTVFSANLECSWKVVQLGRE